MRIYEIAKNNDRTQLAVEILALKETSFGDYLALVFDAMTDKNLAKDLMYTLHAPNLKIGYRRGMEEGFELINSGKLEKEIVN
jgi:hypothetical protein